MTFLYKPFNKKAPQTLGVYAKVPEFDVPYYELEDQYYVEKCLAEGFYAKIFLARHRDTKTQVVLKACHSEVVNLKEFSREFHYSYQLSHHPHIVNVYNVAFQTSEYFIFAQEYAPYADLAMFVGPYGLAEASCKRIAEQLGSALGFMHSKKLVHRDIKLENVLVFDLDFTRVKLADFGGTTKEGLLVRKTNNTWTSFLSPEVLEVVKNERFHCRSSQDVWSFGVMIYLILTGSTPWDRADWVRDVKYAAFMKYQKRETQKIPDNFKRFTPRMLRGFRRLFDHDERDRAKVTDIMKYIKDKWLDPKMSPNKVSFSSVPQISDKDSVMINFSVNNNKAGGKAPVTPEIEKTRTRRLLSSVGLPPDALSSDGDPVQRVSDWLKTCSTDPIPVEEPPDTKCPDSVILPFSDIQRPLTYEQWFVMSTNNNNNSNISNNNNINNNSNGSQFLDFN